MLAVSLHCLQQFKFRLTFEETLALVSNHSIPIDPFQNSNLESHILPELSNKPFRLMLARVIEDCFYQQHGGCAKNLKLEVDHQ